jgi:Fe-S cluster biogenesis protein NfuA
MKSEEKVKTGMKKASSLGEATTTLDDVKKWQEETEKMNKIIDGGNEAAHKMSMHDKVYKVYAANCKKCEAVAAAIKDWISKMEALVKMWESQAGKA